MDHPFGDTIEHRVEVVWTRPGSRRSSGSTVEHTVVGVERVEEVVGVEDMPRVERAGAVWGLVWVPRIPACSKTL